MALRVKRAYDAPENVDGFRVLVDRIWPRGLTKTSARIDLWLKDIAPSAALRKWFGHDPTKWPEFRKRYFRELDEKPEAIAELENLLSKRRVTFVFSARDNEHNNAIALKDYVESKSRRKKEN
ncbi:MAG TPA: DUF488 family protein [Candidatus Binatia bacterium]|jgi:uncharacterized protein YeaO (DUF488 family)